MVSDVIQSTLAAIISNTNFAMGDEQIETPYCVHKEYGEPEYVKAGICGYNYDCEILIVDDTADKVEALFQLVKTAMEALTGQTVSGTQIDLVVLESDDPDFDTESKMYYTILKFTVLTLTR